MVKAGQSDVVVYAVHVCACHSWRVLVAGLLGMNPRVSATIVSLLDRVRGAESLPQWFPLLFSNVAQTSIVPKQPSTSASQVSHAQKVGTQVTVISGGNSSLNIGNRGDPVTDQQATASKLPLVAIPIKVINPSKKRESKTYMLNIPIDRMDNLKTLREYILEQLGKNVVSFDLHFDVGYFSSTHKICFVDGDDVKAELKRLFERGKTLWCDGKSTKPGVAAVVCVDSDSDDEPPIKKPKKTASALESKTLRVDALANELKEKHGNKFNKIQCKLWAEALDVGRHKSKEEPPLGPIWGGQKPKKTSEGGVQAMTSAFTHMANSVASAFSGLEGKAATSVSTPTKVASTSSSLPHGISPGRRIEVQEKLFNQIDMLHRMYEKGAITPSQFET